MVCEHTLTEAINARQSDAKQRRSQDHFLSDQGWVVNLRASQRAK